MTSSSSDQAILDSEATDLAKIILERLRIESWPLTVEDLPDETFLVGGAFRDAFLGRVSGEETSMKENIRMGKEKDKEHTLSLTGKSI